MDVGSGRHHTMSALLKSQLRSLMRGDRPTGRNEKDGRRRHPSAGDDFDELKFKGRSHKGKKKRKRSASRATESDLPRLFEQSLREEEEEEHQYRRHMELLTGKKQKTNRALEIIVQRGERYKQRRRRRRHERGQHKSEAAAGGGRRTTELEWMGETEVPKKKKKKLTRAQRRAKNATNLRKIDLDSFFLGRNG